MFWSGAAGTGRVGLLGLIVLAGLATGCGEPAVPEFDGPRTLGGEEVPAATLNRGRDLYLKLCISCHGAKGDGKGPAASGLQPRDFTAADFRQKSTQGDALPTHDDLVRMIREGAVDRGMPAWNGLPEQDLDALAHFIKTFSSRWSGSGAAGDDTGA